MMSDGLWLALGIMGAVTVWITWRHLLLRRSIRRLEENLRTGAALPSPVAELAALSKTLRSALADLRTALADLRAERDRLSTVLDQMTDGVLIADDGGLVKYSNPAARQILEAPEPSGRSLTEVLRDHRLVQAWERSRSLGTLQTDSVEIPSRQRYLQVIAMPDTHAGGSLLLLQDLTKMRRLEIVRRDFVSNLSHELRTPLASLRALAETLLGGAAADATAGPKFLERMVTEVDALTRMSEELLELSAIESGKAELQLESCDPGALLDSAAERMRLQAERAGLRLIVKHVPGLPTVRADAVRLERVLVSLIHNAVKFTAPGGEIELAAGRAERGAAGEAVHPVGFSVRDTGQGIASDALPRIFERFYTADKARSRGGAGLGLSIARHIVEAHGGRIWAESIEGRGSTFHFTIPASD